MHVISQPPPTTTGPSVCRFPREELRVQHMWAPSHGGGPKSPHVGGPSSVHSHGWGYLLPCLAQGWCLAYCSSWGFAKVGAGKSWIPAAVPAGKKTSGCLCLLAMLPPPARAAQDPIIHGQDQLCCWAGSQLCLQASKPGAPQGDPLSKGCLCRSLHHRVLVRSWPHPAQGLGRR